jgi:hypothetical protein
MDRSPLQLSGVCEQTTRLRTSSLCFPETNRGLVFSAKLATSIMAEHYIRTGKQASKPSQSAALTESASDLGFAPKK